MSAVILKLAPRIPELLTRAAIGDPIAISMLALLGITAGAEMLKKK